MVQAGLGLAPLAETPSRVTAAVQPNTRLTKALMAVRRLPRQQVTHGMEPLLAVAGDLNFRPVQVSALAVRVAGHGSRLVAVVAAAVQACRTTPMEMVVPVGLLVTHYSRAAEVVPEAAVLP